ncbi:MAG TPA: OadG family protein [Candidatus Krumholzibacteriaceae bacterium]|nr:OadG family protein [Candidatus Krumholzibacteriaceae bacterium]
MFLRGLELTLAGMTVVFVFLIIMVTAIQLMSYIANKYFPEKSGETEEGLAAEDNTLIAAIAVAVKNRR